MQRTEKYRSQSKIKSIAGQVWRPTTDIYRQAHKFSLADSQEEPQSKKHSKVNLFVLEKKYKLSRLMILLTC